MCPAALSTWPRETSPGNRVWEGPFWLAWSLLDISSVSDQLWRLSRGSLWLTFAVVVAPGKGVKVRGGCRGQVACVSTNLCVSDRLLPLAVWPHWTLTATSLSAWREAQKTWCGEPTALRVQPGGRPDSLCLNRVLPASTAVVNFSVDPGVVCLYWERNTGPFVFSDYVKPSACLPFELAEPLSRGTQAQVEELRLRSRTGRVYRWAVGGVARFPVFTDCTRTGF